MADAMNRTGRLAAVAALGFPFRVTDGAPATSSGASRIREQIEQVLFTNPRERVFRPDLGAGLLKLVFEPNDSPLWELAKRRIQAELVDALHGEAEPDGIEVEVAGAEETLEITVRYRLTTIGISREEHFVLGDGRG